MTYTNLPVQLTSFIGRERELGEVKYLLSTSRLVTLTGASGCGKTRLALRVAAELTDQYMDGVWVHSHGAGEVRSVKDFPGHRSTESASLRMKLLRIQFVFQK